MEGSWKFLSTVKLKTENRKKNITIHGKTCKSNFYVMGKIICLVRRAFSKSNVLIGWNLPVVFHGLDVPQLQSRPGTDSLAS